MKSGKKSQSIRKQVSRMREQIVHFSIDTEQGVHQVSSSVFIIIITIGFNVVQEQCTSTAQYNTRETKIIVKLGINNAQKRNDK